MLNLQRLLHAQPLEDNRRKLQRQDGSVKRHAPSHLEHHRVWVPHHQWVPDAVRTAQVEKQRHHHETVTKESSENRRADDGPEALQPEDVHSGGERKATRRQHHAAHDVEADPQAPREPVAQVRGRPQPARITQHRRVGPGQKNNHHDRFPESELRQSHLIPSSSLCSSLAWRSLASAAATSARRWVIHQTPPSRTPPSETTSGM